MKLFDSVLNVLTVFTSAFTFVIIISGFYDIITNIGSFSSVFEFLFVFVILTNLAVASLYFIIFFTMEILESWF